MKRAFTQNILHPLKFLSNEIGMQLLLILHMVAGPYLKCGIKEIIS